jgi:hypothetical protein|tara:strand:- start:925 stop:2094 length:1170 start_codon:yes stop_codon:yes gene_type:complete
MKNKVLIIFKYPRANWNEPIINKFSNYYDTEYLYINNYKNKNYKELVKEINNLIKLKDIEIAVFDVDYFKFINFFFIENINVKKKILWTGDDFELHEINSITASACDLVLTTCPLSALKYREKGYDSLVLHGEYGKINNNQNLKKEIDVLFFGNITPDRKDILDYITKEGINLKNVGHESGSHGIAENELVKLISKSKIIINLSKSRTSSVKNYSSENIYKFYYQYKGRLIKAGLNGVACVSEYSPGQEILFKDDEVPTFFSKKECVDILKKLLNDNELLTKYTKKFTSKVCELFEDKKVFEPVYNKIEKINRKKIKLIKIPYWYLRISAKSIMLRNIKLSTLIKIIFQFNIIIKLINNSNFVVKFLIILESIINIFWYSIVFTLKSKK